MMSRKRETRIWAQAGWLGCAAVAVLLMACGKKEEKGQSAPPTVMTFPLMGQDVTDTGEWFGYLRGIRDTDLHPRVTGFLLSQDYVNGSYVNEGDVLFRIDPATFQAELDLAKANLEAAQAGVVSARATVEQAQMDVDRYAPLVSNGAVSEKELNDANHRLRAAKASLDAALATVEQNKAAVDKAKINLEYTVVRAPYAGIMSTAEVSTGDLVSPATKLANITAVDTVRLEFGINSDHMIDAFRKYGDLANGGKSTLPPPPPVDILLEDGSVFPQKGKLTAMESKVGASGLITVEGEVTNPDHLLRGGMPVRVRIPLQRKHVFLVPEQSIRSVLRNDFIIVVDAKNEPHMVPVVIQGKYPVTVQEEGGYRSEQQMVAVEGLHTPLPEVLRSLGYEEPAQALVVADEVNAVHASNISSANSRLSAESKQPRGTITPAKFSYRPQMLPAVAAASQGKSVVAEDKPDVKPTMPPIPVKVTPLLRQDVQVTDEWFGTLRGVEETDIHPQVSGFVKEQHFRDGSLVKKGDRLFTIDPAPYEAAVEEARANLLMAKASYQQALSQLERAQQDFQRYDKLNKTSPGAISDKTLTDARSAIQMNEAGVLKAKAAISQMEAALKLAEINLAYTEVRAPFDGRVGIHKPSIGALVSPTDMEPLVTLSSINPMRVDFQVSGKGALSGIAAFETLQDRHGGDEKPGFELVLEDGTVYPERGEVVSADNALNRSTGTLKVVGHVDNKDGGLRSGMSVRVRAGMNSVRGAYLVPARAPMSAQGRDMLVLVRPDGAPQMLPITRGSIVNVAVPDAEGKPGPVQPMQIVDVDRNLVAAMILAKSKAPSLESVVLGGAGVENWKDFLLKQTNLQNSRELLEKYAKKQLPDDAPQKVGAADWDELLLKETGTKDMRGAALRMLGAKDELDLIAASQGAASVLEMALKELGYQDMNNVPVVVEGSLMAAQAFAANMQSGSQANKLNPTPFHYSPPRTVVESVTADGSGDSSSSNLPVDQHGATAQPEEK